MKYIQGFNRQQTTMQVDCPDSWVAEASEVRAIDAFAASLDCAALGFRTDFDENGRPAYHPSDLLRLFIYGYLNRTRSSRELERECARNLEVMWLMRGLKPDHNTIASFRKDNPEAIARAFAATVSLAKHHNLIGGKLLAGDGTKLRAQNGRKSNFNQKKIDEHIGYIDRQVKEYTRLMATEDGDTPVSAERKENYQRKINKHNRQRLKHLAMQAELERTGQSQISTSDPDSRMMITRGINTEVVYNIQSTVDAENNLLIDFKTTNQKDLHAMGPMLERACDVLQANDFTALYDKGYYNEAALQEAEELGVDVLVATPEISSHAPDPAFDVALFHYNPKEDTYTCPAGHLLTTNGHLYSKRSRKTETYVQHYKTSECQNCPLRSQCTKNSEGRLIERSAMAHLADENRQRLQANPELYKKRQQIVEHPFGTIKRQWGYDHIMTKRGIRSASADVGLIFLAYNLRRMFNILGPATFQGDKTPKNHSFNTILASYKAIWPFRHLLVRFSSISIGQIIIPQNRLFWPSNTQMEGYWTD